GRSERAQNQRRPKARRQPPAIWRNEGTWSPWTDTLPWVENGRHEVNSPVVRARGSVTRTEPAQEGAGFAEGKNSRHPSLDASRVLVSLPSMFIFVVQTRPPSRKCCVRAARPESCRRREPGRQQPRSGRTTWLPPPRLHRKNTPPGKTR